MFTMVNKKTWRTCDFPVWERVKHIVLIYNAHPSYKKKKESGQNPAYYATLNTVLKYVFQIRMWKPNFEKKMEFLIITVTCILLN